MQNFEISYSSNTINPLQVEFIIDGISYFNGPADKGIININLPMSAEITTHLLEIYITGKQQLIKSTDDINAAVIITQFDLNGISLFPLLKGEYYHNSNGFGDNVSEQLVATEFWLGYDGVVKFNFCLPLSYWLAKDYPY